MKEKEKQPESSLRWSDVLRPLTYEELQAYIQEIRPRILTVVIRHDRLKFRWFLPMWAIEEPLRFLLRTLRLMHAIAPGISKRIQTRIGSNVFLLPTRDPSPLWPAVDAFFSEKDRDLLAVVVNDPIVEIRHAQSHLLITQARI